MNRKDRPRRKCPAKASRRNEDRVTEGVRALVEQTRSHAVDGIEDGRREVEGKEGVWPLPEDKGGNARDDPRIA